MQHQLQAKEEALEKLQKYNLQVKSDSSISCSFYDNDFATFEKHTTRIGSKLLKKMGCQGKGFGINGQAIVNPIKVEEFTHHERLGHVRKDFGEFCKTKSYQPMMDDGSTYHRCIRNKFFKVI